MAGEQIRNFVGLRVKINNTSIPIPNNNLVSLKVARVIGDSVNSFTLEVFDDTADKVETILAGSGNQFCPIELWYRGKANETEEHFTGTIYNWVPSFIGASMMLSITGITGENSQGLLAKDTVCWVKPAKEFKAWFNNDTMLYTGSDDGNSTYSQVYVFADIATQDIGEYENAIYKSEYDNGALTNLQPSLGGQIPNEYMEDKNCWTARSTLEINIINDGTTELWGTKTVAMFPMVKVVDPIMSAYEGSEGVNVLQGPGLSGQTTLTGGEIAFVSLQKVAPHEVFKRVINAVHKVVPSIELGEVDETEPVYYDNWTQQSQTPFEFIEKVLCARAVSKETGEAGFYFAIVNGKANFKKRNYMADSAASVTVQYGKKDSNVISFSTAVKGSVIMAGGTFDENGNMSVDAEVLDDISGDVYQVNMNGVQAAMSNTVETIQVDYSNYTPKLALSSDTMTNSAGASAIEKLNAISKLAAKAELKIWGTTDPAYTPGNYIQVNVIKKSGYHYSSGKYWILKCEDSVSAGGFIKTLSLIKMGGDVTALNTSLLNSSEIGYDDEAAGVEHKERLENAVNQLNADIAASKVQTVTAQTNSTSPYSYRAVSTNNVKPITNVQIVQPRNIN